MPSTTDNILACFPTHVTSAWESIPSRQPSRSSVSLKLTEFVDITILDIVAFIFELVQNAQTLNLLDGNFLFKFNANEIISPNNKRIRSITRPAMSQVGCSFLFRRLAINSPTDPLEADGLVLL